MTQGLRLQPKSSLSDCCFASPCETSCNREQLKNQRQHHLSFDAQASVRAVGDAGGSEGVNGGVQM